MKDKELKAELFFLKYMSLLTIRFGSCNWLQFVKNKEVVISYSKAKNLLFIQDENLVSALISYDIKDVNVFVCHIILKHLKYEMVVRERPIFYYNNLSIRLSSIQA
jgi:hypothetical protein